MTRDRPGFCAVADGRSPAVEGGESGRAGVDGPKKDPGAEGRAAGRSRCLPGLRPPDRPGAGERSGADSRSTTRRARFGSRNRTEPGRNSARERGRPGATRRTTRDRPGRGAVADGRSPAIEGVEYRRTCRQDLRRTGAEGRKTNPGEEGRAAGRSRSRPGLRPPDRAGDRSGADSHAPRHRRACFGTGDRPEPGRNSARERGKPGAARRMTREPPRLGRAAVAGGRSPAIEGVEYRRTCRQDLRRAGAEGRKKDPGAEGRAAGRSRCRPGLRPPDRASGRGSADSRSATRRARSGTGNRTEPGGNSVRERENGEQRAE